MPFIAESRKRLGFLVFWHHGYKKDGFPLENRANILGVDILGVNDKPGEAGEYVTGRDAMDLTGFTSWRRNSRPIDGVRTIWPCVVVTPSGATTGGPTEGDYATTPGTGTGVITIDDGPAASATTPGNGYIGSGSPAGAVLSEDNWDGRYAPPGFGEPPAELG